MIAEKIKKIESGLKPCACGGQLYISKSVVTTKKGKVSLVHFVVKCRKCGKWCGGFTAKSARRQFREEVAQV